MANEIRGDGLTEVAGIWTNAEGPSPRTSHHIVFSECGTCTQLFRRSDLYLDGERDGNGGDTRLYAGHLTREEIAKYAEGQFVDLDEDAEARILAGREQPITPAGAREEGLTQIAQTATVPVDPMDNMTCGQTTYLECPDCGQLYKQMDIVSMGKEGKGIIAPYTGPLTKEEIALHVGEHPMALSISPGVQETILAKRETTS
jgi:hypothetical protein